MKVAALLFGLVFFVSLGIPQENYPNAKAVIFGHVVDQNNQPAKQIEVEGMPLGVALGAILPRSRTDENGNYRLGVPWWGRYTVYANDLNAGYSSFTTPPADPDHLAEVTVSTDHPQAEFDFQLPRKAGFLHFHLTNAKTGAPISRIEVTVALKGPPARLVYSDGTSADKSFLVPSNKDVLLHVTSWGYKEWDKSVGGGKAIRLAPGAELTLNVKLNPASN